MHPFYPFFDKRAPEMHGDHAMFLYWLRQKEIWKEQERIDGYKNVVYALFFGDEKLKIGFTADINKRMRYYKQEARRHGVTFGMWWYSAGFEEKSSALLMERLALRQFDGWRLRGTREWFKCQPTQRQDVMNLLMKIRRILTDSPSHIADEVRYFGDVNMWSEAKA